MRGVIAMAMLLHVTMTTQTTPPNILFILVDDWGYQDVGFRGSNIKTPEMDALAESGVILENHYVSSICAPTRASLLTGRYPIRTGYWNGNVRLVKPWGLPPEETTMAEMLRRRGYSTHAVGKWHLGFHKEEYLPVRRGFDTFLGFMTSCTEDHFQHTILLSEEMGGEVFDFRKQHVTDRDEIRDEVLYGMRGKHSADIFTNRTIEILQDHDPSRPVFVYLAYSSVHSPVEVSDGDLQKFAGHLRGKVSQERQTLAAMVSKVDEGVGRIMKELRRSGLYDNTLVVVSSDNGGVITHSSNYPLRGTKRSLYEGGVRSIAFLHSPLLPRKGIVSKEIFHVVDWYSTFQRLSGREVEVEERETGRRKTQLELDGVDIWGAIATGSPLSRSEVLLNYGHKDHCHECHHTKIPPDYGFAVRRGKWKFIENTQYRSTKFSTKNCEGHWDRCFIVKGGHVEKTELYNLELDPREEVNVARLHGDVVEVLRHRKDHYYDLIRPLYELQPIHLNVTNGTIFW